MLKNSGKPVVDVSTLRDHCFVLASHALTELAESAEMELGRKPTLEELCEILMWGFRGCNEELVADVHPGRIERVVCKIRNAKVENLSPGDVVAIPSAKNKCYIGVFVEKNRFGCAFGFFRGLWPCRPLTNGRLDLVPCGPPIYTTLHSLWDGTWRLIGHLPELLGNFTDSPEVYHAKSDHLNNDSIGPFGSAEAPSGTLRSIDAKEAESVGLLNGSYRQTVLPKYVASVLAVRGCT